MLDKPSLELHNKIRVAGESSLHWKGRCSPRDCQVDKGTLPCVGCVGNMDAFPNRSYEGVLSSMDELTSLAVLSVHCLSSPINPKNRLA